MCFDPVTLTLAAIGGGLSAAGQAQNNRAAKKQMFADTAANVQQMQQDVEEAKLRTRIANEYAARQRGYGDQNQGSFNATLAAVAPANDAIAYDGSVAARTAEANKAIGDTTQMTGLLGSASPAVSSEFARVFDQAFGDARASAGRKAAVSAYGDTGQRTSDRLADGARAIDTTNNFARGDMALLGADQDLQAFQIRRPVYRPTYDTSKGNTLKGLGSLVGSFAGSGKAGSFGNALSAYMPKFG